MFIKNRRQLYEDEADVNPMDFVGNLSDVMLVLAVGIMLALVSAFHVNLSGQEQGAFSPASIAGTTKIEIPLDQAQNTNQISQKQLDEAGFTEYGTVYTDAEGNLYVLGVSDE